MQDPDLPFAAVLFILFCIGGTALLYATRSHSRALRFQERLFLLAFLARFALSIVIYQFGLVAILGDEDASGWYGGVGLMQAWQKQGAGLLDLPVLLLGAFEGHHRGYSYLTGLLFYLTASPARLPAAVLNCFFGALTVIFAYRIAALLFSDWVARRVGWMTCFFPSLIIWSAQTLKEPVVILLETIVLYGCVRLKVSGFSLRHLILCGIAIVALAPFRFYAAFIAGAAVLLTLLLPQIGKRRFSFGTALLMAALVIPLLVSTGALAKYEAELEKFDLDRIQGFKNAVATGQGSGSGVKQNYDLRSPTGMATALLVGGAHLMLAPFPWQLGGASLRMLGTAPELFIWWWLFFVGVVPGFWYLIRNRFGEIQPLLYFIFGLGLLYSLMFGNVGLIYRQRAQLMPWLLIFAAVGLQQRLLKKALKRHQPGSRMTPQVVTHS